MKARSGHRRHTLPTLLAIVLVGAFGANGIRPAFAVCGPKEQIFVQRVNVQSSLGVVGTNQIRNTAVDTATGCNFLPMRWSTAHMRGPQGVDWIEIGWRSYWSGGNRVYRIFVEAGLGLCNPICNTTLNQSWSTTYGSWNAWKVWAVEGTTRWKLFVGGTQYGPANGHSMPWGGGIPMGETGRGGTGTSAYDHFINLSYRDSTGVWHPWTLGSQVASGEIAGYSWVPDPLNGDEYEIRTA